MNDTDEALRAAFHRRMRQVYDDAARLGYRPTRFLQKVEAVGGLEAARQWLAQPGPSEGLIRLWELGRLDISMEAAVAEESRWWPLFTEAEIATARRRLAELGYRFKENAGPGEPCPD